MSDAAAGGATRPGEELVAAGLRDLARGEVTVAALLVEIGAPRLRRLGVRVPPAAALGAQPEHRLYALLAAQWGRGAHARYNALVRRLVSYEHALERERGRAQRARGDAAI